MAPSPQFSPFGHSPLGVFSPFGFGLPAPVLLLAAGGLALTSFRSTRGIEGGPSDEAGATYCVQVACYCGDRGSSVFGRLRAIAQGADTQSYEGLQRLVSDACLALLRASPDWLAGRCEHKTSRLFARDVEGAYNQLVVQERAKWEAEQRSMSRAEPGRPTYFVATLVVLLRTGTELPAVAGAADMRKAVAQLAADVVVEDNLLAAEVLWTPEEEEEVMERDDMFLNFPELVAL